MRFRQSLALVLLLVTALACKGQMFTVTGKVIILDKQFFPQFQLGDPIQISMDLARPLVEIAPNTYHVPLTFTVAGTSIFSTTAFGEVALKNNDAPPYSPFAYDGLALTAPHTEANFFGYLSFNLFTRQDVISAPVFLPNGIPMSAFVETGGSYFQYSREGGFDGVIGWTITGYNNQPSRLSAVPEPSTYALGASLGLVVLCLVRRYAAATK